MKQIELMDEMMLVYPDEWEFFKFDEPKESKYAGVVSIGRKNCLFSSAMSILDMSAADEGDVIKKLCIESEDAKEMINKKGDIPWIFAVAERSEKYQKYMVTKDAGIIRRKEKQRWKQEIEV